MLQAACASEEFVLCTPLPDAVQSQFYFCEIGVSASQRIPPCIILFAPFHTSFCGRDALMSRGKRNLLDIDLVIHVILSISMTIDGGIPTYYIASSATFNGLNREQPQEYLLLF